MINNQVLKLLSIEDNLAHACWIDRVLKEWEYRTIQIARVAKISEAIARLEHYDFDVILLDLSLPDSQGLESLKLIRQKAPQLPIVILTGTEDENLAIAALRQGAQDYLIKGEFEAKVLYRAIQYAIERYRSEFQLRQEALMKKMLDEIRQSINLETILQTTVREIQKFLDVEQVLICRRQAKGRDSEIFSASLDAKSAQMAVDSFISAFQISSLEETPIQAVENTKISGLSEDSIRDLRCLTSYLILPIWLREPVNSTYEELACPLFVSDDYGLTNGFWGVLIAYNTTVPRKWQGWEISFLQQLTTQVTVAIEQSQLCYRLQNANQKLQQLAILDGLTEIANRRYFDLVLEKEWQRSIREQQPLSLILCDVDYFKAYNDRYGHQQGDLCLQKIARILQESTQRAADLVARYGGEEFAIVLPNTDGKGASFIAQKIARIIARSKIPHAKSQVSNYVTCSMGISTIIPHTQQSAIDLIKNADRLLYQAKKMGRNQIAAEDRTSDRELKII